VDSLRFAPKIPKEWKSFKLQYRYRETVYGIAFQNQGGGKTVKSLTCDGQNIVSKTLRLDDDRKVHNVEVVLE
jgi:cyclic beta-1,2-glucan synthetase